MRALVFDGSLRAVDDYPVPAPPPGECLVRVGMAGICNTDLEIVKGYMGYRGVLGHEFVGVVETAPEGAERLIGRRVCGEINVGCGGCGGCLSGRPNHCPARTVLGILGRDGALAEYLTLPPGNLHEVPEGVPDDAAVFTEPLAAALRIPEMIHVGPRDRVLVMGDGKLGLLIALALRPYAQLVLAGRHEGKMDIARAQGVEAVHEAALGSGGAYDVVVDATGSPEGFLAAMGRVRPEGTLVLKSTAASGAELNLAPLVINEIRVVGSRCGPFGPALRALSGGWVDPRPMIGGVYPATDMMAAVEAARARGALKVLVDFGR